MGAHTDPTQCQRTYPADCWPYVQRCQNRSEQLHSVTLEELGDLEVCTDCLIEIAEHVQETVREGLK